jgi:hypothetical protein
MSRVAMHLAAGVGGVCIRDLKALPIFQEKP